MSEVMSGGFPAVVSGSSILTPAYAMAPAGSLRVSLSGGWRKVDVDHVKMISANCQ